MAESERSTPASTTDREVAFEQLLERHLADAYRLAALLLSDRTEAEDVTHDAAIRAWEAWPSLRDVSRFDAWFQRILVNLCRDRLRRRRLRAIRVEDHDPSETESRVDDPQVGSAERLSLRTALERLTPDHRAVVVLRYYADLSIDEIADRTSERPGTVRSRLHYALRELRAAYDAGGRAVEDVR